jgi:anti-anti-sigma factor
MFDERFDESMTHLDEFEVVVTCSDAGVCVRVQGQLEAASVDVLRTALDGAMRVGFGDVDVDLSQTTFCDPSCLSLLLAAHRRLERVGRQLRVVDPVPPRAPTLTPVPGSR